MTKPHETQNINSKEHMPPHVHCSVVYNHQDVEAAQVSINRWVDKTTMGYLCNGILLSHENEGNLTLCNSMGGSGEHYTKWNKPEKNKCHMISLICAI